MIPSWIGAVDGASTGRWRKCATTVVAEVTTVENRVGYRHPSPIPGLSLHSQMNSPEPEITPNLVVRSFDRGRQQPENQSREGDEHRDNEPDKVDHLAAAVA